MRPICSWSFACHVKCGEHISADRSVCRQEQGHRIKREEKGRRVDCEDINGSKLRQEAHTSACLSIAGVSESPVKMPYRPLGVFIERVRYFDSCVGSSIMGLPCPKSCPSTLIMICSFCTV